MVAAIKTRRQACPDIDLSEVKLPKVKAFNPFKIKPLPDQIRKRFFGIKELANSIEEVGQVTPVIVTENSDDPDFDAQLVDGERRLLACRYAELPVVAFIWDGKTDPEDIYARSVAANFGRQAHDCIEISQAIQRFKKTGKSIEQIARVFGKSIAWVIQHYSLRKLHPIVQKWLLPAASENGDGNGKPFKVGDKQISVGDMKSTGSKKIRPPLTFSLALLLISLPPDLQVSVGRNIVAGKMSLAEARRYVLGIGRKTGQLKRRRSPAEQRNTLLSVAGRVRHMIGVYVDMNGKEFNNLLASASKDDLSKLARSLGKLSEEVTMLTDCVESEKKKR